MSRGRARHHNLSHLLHPIRLQELVRDWLKEDTPGFDYGGFVVGEKEETAVLLCKSDGILCGCPFVNAIFAELGCEVEWFKPEGDVLRPVCKVGHVRGKVRHLLLGERVALNCLSRASGIATYCRRLSHLAKSAGWHGDVAGTRKTTPGFRMVEKYAMLVGGVDTHRMDLSAMIMLKDNHIWTAGNITQAVKDARSVGGFSTKIEVECRSMEEALEAAQSEADIVMLDNFDPAALHTAAKQLKDRYPVIQVEASGGVTESTVTDFMGPHVDIISLSSTTQGCGVVDFSFKILVEGRDPHNPTIRTA